MRAGDPSRRAERLLDGRYALGESPAWSVREQALYWVDLRAPSLQRWHPATGQHQSWPMPALIGAVVLSAAGGVLVALSGGVAHFDPTTASLRPLIAPEPPAMGNRMNDSKADRAGRLWTSTMRDFGAAATGALYRIDTPAAATRVLDGLVVPNALAWSPDDRILYFADSRDGRLRAYAFDAASGTLGAMRILVAQGVVPGAPDGATVDADGCVWNARYGGSCVVRITPHGAIDRIVELPVSQPTSCALGDADLRTLYITTAHQRLDAGARRAQPDAGALFAVRVDTPGVPEPECRL